MEVPAFSRSYCAFTDSGTDVINIPISMSGLNIDDLYKSNCSIFYCMPHCHYPTCYKMSEELKMDLLKWASESPGRYIIGDSYDSELTWDSSDTLYSMDKNGKVIFLNTFSRALCPGLKTAYMILPDELLSKWRKNTSFILLLRQKQTNTLWLNLLKRDTILSIIKPCDGYTETSANY